MINAKTHLTDCFSKPRRVGSTCAGPRGATLVSNFLNSFPYCIFAVTAKQTGAPGMRSVTKRCFSVPGFIALTLGITAISPVLAGQAQGGEPDWSFNATIIEACSCPNPCPCNFNSAKPAAHSGHEGHGAAMEYF